jgi:hypothetical protein
MFRDYLEYLKMDVFCELLHLGKRAICDLQRMGDIREPGEEPCYKSHLAGRRRPRVPFGCVP